MTQEIVQSTGAVPAKRRANSFLSKDKRDIWKYIADSGFNPIEQIIAIAQGNLKCGACRGEAETRYVMRDDHDKILRNPDGSLKFHVRVCESCYGSGYEHVEPRTMLAAASELAKKMIPDLKQIDPNAKEGAEQAAVNVKWATINFVQPPPAVIPPKPEVETIDAELIDE